MPYRLVASLFVLNTAYEFHLFPVFHMKECKILKCYSKHIMNCINCNYSSKFTNQINDPGMSKENPGVILIEFL